MTPMSRAAVCWGARLFVLKNTPQIEMEDANLIIWLPCLPGCFGERGDLNVSRVNVTHSIP